jgi:beta-glucosidase
VLSRFCLLPVLLPVLFSAALAAQSKPDLYLDPKKLPAERAHDLVSRMTVEEKASQLEDWAVSIPHLGVPDYQSWNEALHGVARAGYATVFPQAIGMAATWDLPLVQRMGETIATEGRAKFNQAQREGNRRIYYGLTFWSPNINLDRDPRWGRGQETYGEDPFLTSRLGVAFIHGVQGDDLNHLKALATAKHFAVHSGPEPLRHGFNVDPSPRDLEESYLPAFRASVVEGHVQSVMCAYNAVDGAPACASQKLLKETLREAWGFHGSVVSDCGAVADIFSGHKKAEDILHASVLAIQAGTDLSCSSHAPGFNSLAEAVRKGMISEDLLTQSVQRLYTHRFQLGFFDPADSTPLDKIPATMVASPAGRILAQRAAEESVVLLKNDGVLPLKPGRIAVIGPNADLLVSLLGNYAGTPLHPVTPVDGVKNTLRGNSVLYAQGSVLAEGISLPVPRSVFGAGLKTEFFASTDWTGRPFAILTEPLIQDDWENAFPVPQLETHNYSVRWSGILTPPAPGHYKFSLEAQRSFPFEPVESFRILLDGKLQAEGGMRLDSEEGHPVRVNAPGTSPLAPPPARPEKRATFEIDFADSRPHEICVEYSHSGDPMGGGLTLRWEAPAPALLDEAVARAKEADTVVAFVGLSPQLEGEELKIKIDGFAGGDKTTLDLPAPQQKLLEALKATGKPLVVVLESGSAVSLNWAKDKADAILAAWYPGVEGGTAIARVLAGLVNPAGRLPITFYASLDGLPEFTDYAFRRGATGRTYRYFPGKPLWGFGYGLSYTTFKYGPLRLSAETINAGDPLTATVTVTNTGKVGGDEVVEAYLKTPQADGPIQTLVGFQRITLSPNASKDVALSIDPRWLSSVDEQGRRSILEGKYTLTLSSAQPQETEVKSEAAFTINGAKELPR